MAGRRFYILGPLMGGYGSKAFLAQELSPSGRLRPAVLIFLAEELIEDQQLFQMIREETSVAVRIDHLNVITVLGLVRLEDGYARVVEFADGESLRSVLSRARELRRKIPPPVAAAVLADACAGVHHAHQMGVRESGRPLLHGAVRPETLLVTFRGIGMVTGYGTAVIREGMRDIQAANVVISDPYSAPELIARGDEAVSVQADVYGLGVVLFEVISGEPPIEIPAAPDQGLLGIAHRAMAVEAGERFSSAMDMRAALLQEIEVATKHEVSTFMQELFPNDMPQIQARRIMLKRGQLEYDADLPRLSSDGPPETIDLVWRYPIREVPASATKPSPPVEPAPVSQPVPAVEPAPVAKPAPAAEPAPAVEPAPAAAPPQAVEPPPAAPVLKRLPPVPPPPEEKRRKGRVPPLAYLMLVLLAAAAFVLVPLFSNRGKQEAPEPEKIPVALQRLVEEPTPISKPPPPETEPAEKKTQSPGRKATKRDTTKRKPARPGSKKGVGYLNVVAPDGSRVYIRGRQVGLAPLKRFELPAGRHKVVVVKTETGAKYERMVPIGSGQEMTLTVEFY